MGYPPSTITKPSWFLVQQIQLSSQKITRHLFYFFRSLIPSSMLVGLDYRPRRDGASAALLCCVLVARAGDRKLINSPSRYCDHQAVSLRGLEKYWVIDSYRLKQAKSPKIHFVLHGFSYFQGLKSISTVYVPDTTVNSTCSVVREEIQ